MEFTLRPPKAKPSQPTIDINLTDAPYFHFPWPQATSFFIDFSLFPFVLDTLLILYSS